ncbi:MAG: HIT domain-containing protein [Dehalococcoidia bacterium]|nr:HIT domain-containing protein [Dehalococcoidia bacterium]
MTATLEASVTSKPCTFCRIVAGDIDADVVFEGEATLGFLDHRPLFPGHVLLIPREHHEVLGELPVDLVAPLFEDARTLSKAVEGAMDADGTFVSVNNRVSQSVPHLHVHVIPRRFKDGLRGFFWPRNPYEDDAHRARVAQQLREAVALVTE